MTSFTPILVALLVAGACAQCPPSYTFLGGRCLLFGNDQGVTFTEGSDLCQANGGTLAKIDDCSLLGEVASYIQENNLGSFFWIGASDFLQEGTFLWPDGTPVQMGAPFWSGSSFGSFEPQADGGDCVAMAPLDGYYFHNEECASDYSAICQRPVDETRPCTEPFELVDGGCYQFLDTLDLTWQEGRTVCQAAGGDLAIIDDCQSMAPIISRMQNTGKHFWIGGVRVLDSFAWIDGSPMPEGTPFWGRDQSDGLEPDAGFSANCVELNGSDGYYFRDYSCDFAQFYLCEAPLEAAA